MCSPSPPNPPLTSILTHCSVTNIQGERATLRHRSFASNPLLVVHTGRRRYAHAPPPFPRPMTAACAPPMQPSAALRTRPSQSHPGCGAEGKCGKDAAEWLPPRNRCWFAARIVQVRRKYALTIDRREVDALERVLSSCASTEMVFHDGGGVPAPAGSPASQDVPAPGAIDALARWDDNRNGRITCKEARRHGIAPVPRGHPAYPFMRDRDGIVCE